MKGPMPLDAPVTRAVPLLGVMSICLLLSAVCTPFLRLMGMANDLFHQGLAELRIVAINAHQVALEETERVLTEFGLSRKGYAALATVVTDAPISQQRLSQRIGMDPATMVDVIDALEESGYLERRRNPNDRREYALRA